MALAARAVPEWQATLDALGREGLDGTGLVGDSGLAEAAGRIRVPVEFLLPWDDELVPREEGLAMFGGLGSREKTLHVNPGRHTEVPEFELESSERFLARHLGPALRPSI